MLVAINVYPERLDGDVVVWLVISQQDGKVHPLTFGIDDTKLLLDALAEALDKAEQMDALPPLT